MRKYTLIKFFNGEASEAEIDAIFSWVSQSENNKRYFARQKALHAALLATSEKRQTENDPRALPRWKVFIAYTGATAAIVFMMTLGIHFFQTNKKPQNISAVSAITETAANPRWHSMYTHKGVKGKIVLPDSTRVWLNADSEIAYPEIFTGSTREVRISGEAFFEVAKDTLHPMIVHTNRNFSIEVVGTSFNVKTYANDKEAITTLYSGSIRMHYKNKANAPEKTLTLLPNETFIYKPESLLPTKPVRKTAPEKEKAWKEGILVFDNTPMPEVIKILERWHGTEFRIRNHVINNYKLTAEFHSESIVQIMEIIRLIMPIQYHIAQNVVTLE